MHRVKFLLAFVVAINAAPSPFYSLVETPTSRVEQRIIMTPQLHQSYRIQPQHVIPYSNFHYPKQQIVYYQQDEQNFHQQPSLSLHGLKHDSPYWQELRKQMSGQGMQDMKEGGKEETGPMEEILEGPDKKPEFPMTTIDPLLEENKSNKIAPKIETDSESIEVNSAENFAVKSGDGGDIDVRFGLEESESFERTSEESGMVQQHGGNMGEDHHEDHHNQSPTPNGMPALWQTHSHRISNEIAPPYLPSDQQQTFRFKSDNEMPQQQSEEILETTTAVEAPEMPTKYDEVHQDNFISEPQNLSSTGPTLFRTEALPLQSASPTLQQFKPLSSQTLCSNLHHSHASSPQQAEAFSSQILSSTHQSHAPAPQIVSPNLHQFKPLSSPFLSQNLQQSHATPPQIASPTLRRAEALSPQVSSSKHQAQASPPQIVSSTLHEFKPLSSPILSQNLPQSPPPQIASPSLYQAQAPLPQLFKHNNRYYIVSGQPEFYGNYGARTPIFSLQELQPVVRAVEVNDYARGQENAPTPMPSREPASTLRINVVDEDEAEERERDVEERARSRMPSSKKDKMSREEEKREQLVSEGRPSSRELSDESSIAQAKPNGIAIAGEGGVASSKPVANAISGPNGLSVASPLATAVAGNFNADDEDRKQVMTNKKSRQPPYKTSFFN